MASIDDIDLWAEDLVVDVVTGTPQRLSISDSLWEVGFNNQSPVITQHVNQLNYLISGSLLEQQDIDFDRDHPIGILEITNTNNNPSIDFGRGTWVSSDVGLSSGFAWKRTA